MSRQDAAVIRIDLSDEEEEDADVPLSQLSPYAVARQEGEGAGTQEDTSGQHGAAAVLQPSSHRDRGRRSLSGGAAGSAAAAGQGRVRDFRISAKWFALTYPQCPCARVDFDPIFKLKFRPAEYASAREAHADGSYHLHVYVAYVKRTDVQCARHFDVSIDGIIYHPNIQRGKNRAAWLKYISKEGDHGVDAVRREGDEDESDVMSAALGKRKGLYNDLQWSRQFRVLQQLKSVEYPIKLECEGKTYEMHKPDPAIKKRSWWIIAAPNAGKTRWINRVFANTAVYTPRMGKYPYEGYADQDIVIYDDRKGICFEEFSDVLNTWDMVHPVFGEVRFNVQNWKMGHSRNVIVLSNKTIEESVPPDDVTRMKKRFIQIVHPVLLLPSEMSSDEEEEEAAQAQEADYAAAVANV